MKLYAMLCVKRYSKKKKLDSEILKPQDLALKFNEVGGESVQKMVWVSEWVVLSCHVRNHKILLDKKTNKLKLVKQCSRQASEIKT